MWPWILPLFFLSPSLSFIVPSFSCRVCLLALTHVIIHIFIFPPSLFLVSLNSSHTWMHISTINKTTWSLFNGEFIMSYFPHSYNPFKHATSRQPVVSASRLVRYSSSHLVSLSVRVAMGNSEEPSLSMAPWQQGLLNVYVG